MNEKWRLFEKKTYFTFRTTLSFSYKLGNGFYRHKPLLFSSEKSK